MNALAFFQTLEVHPHWSLWIVLPLLPFAIAAIVMLYFQQRRLASRRMVLWLTAVRLLLLLLAVLLFFRPSGRWEQTRVSSGTLWFLLDQSPSMQVQDSQATPAERAYWAEGLGYLGTGVRPAKPDLVYAHFIAVQSEFAALRPDAADSDAGSAEARRAHAAELAKRLVAWADALDKVRKMANADPSFTARGVSARDSLDRISNFARKGASTAIDWDTIQTNLTLAANDFAAIVAQSAEDFDRTDGRNPAVLAAVARLGNPPPTRADLAADFLTANPNRGNPPIADLLQKYRVRIAGFSDTAAAAGTVDKDSFAQTIRTELSPGAPSPTGSAGRSTNIIAGLQTVGEQIAPDEPASVIIVTDGRHNAPGDPAETARLLAARGVHVYGLLVGSHAVSADAAVDQVDAPEWIFKGDTIKANASLRFDGLAGKLAHVEFRRAGTLIDSQNVPIVGNQMVKRLDFTDRPPESSAVLEYEVRIAELPGEVNKDNNDATFRVAVKKDKLFALIIEDRPRWEYRYLAAYLSRDSRLKLQTVLLNPATVQGITGPPPAKASPANPQLEAQILPESREEWMAFDLIILGDLKPGTLTNTQQQYIAAAVRDKGATLITIAGERSMPAEFANQPLADILPVTLNPQWDDAAIARHKRFGFRPGLAPEGNGSVLGQLSPSAETNALLWSSITPWYWHSPYTQAKPSASVIWSITENAPPAAGEGLDNAANPGVLINAARKNALLATMSVGLGKSLYLASDQTWRLRQLNGTNAQDRFWGQVLTWAVGSDLPAGGKFVRFGSNQPRYSQGQEVIITARVLKEDLTPNSGLTFYALAKPVKTGSAPSTTAPQSSTEAQFIESPETPGYYTAKLGGLPAGDFEISLLGAEVERLLAVDPSVTQKTLAIKILPQLDLEQRNMNTDPELLQRIARAGGGFSLDANYADILAAHLPAIERTETSVEEIGFFTDPAAKGTWIAHLAFITLFALLLTLEWTLRKIAGLV